MAFNNVAQTSPGNNDALPVIQVKSDGKMDNSFLSTGINANLLADGSVSNTEFQYLNGASSNLQDQINALESGISFFNAVAMATVNIDISAPASAVIDGVTVTNGESIFLLGTVSGGAQTTASEGGIWIFNGTGNALTRPATYDTWAKVTGSKVYVEVGGTAKGGSNWYNTNASGGTLGTTAITYNESQDSFIGENGIAVTGNVISIKTDADIDVNSITAVAQLEGATLKATAETNQIALGTANTTTITMSVLSGNRVVTLPDADSNTVRPVGAAVAGEYVSHIGSNGVQNKAIVINQLLAGLSAGAGTIASTDTIIQAFNKIAGIINRPFPAATSPVDVTLAQSDVQMVMTANNKNVTLPLGTSDIGQLEYTVYNGTGVTNTNILLQGSDVLIGDAVVSGAGSSVTFRYTATNEWRCC